MQTNFYKYRVVFKDKTEDWICVSASDRKLAERVMKEFTIPEQIDVLRYECVSHINYNDPSYDNCCRNALLACKGNAGYFITDESPNRKSTLTPNGYLHTKGKFFNCSRHIKLEKLFDGVLTETK